jgi:hypothetical protein
LRHPAGSNCRTRRRNQPQAAAGAADVVQKTGNRQEPFDDGSLPSEDSYFVAK